MQTVVGLFQPHAKKTITGLAGHRNKGKTLLNIGINRGLCHRTALGEDAIDLRIVGKNVLHGSFCGGIVPSKVQCCNHFSCRTGSFETVNSSIMARSVDRVAFDAVKHDDFRIFGH